MRVPAEDTVHLYRVDTAGQLRGTSWLTPAILPAHELTTLLDSLSIRAKVAAQLVGSITQDPGIDSPLPPSLQVIGEDAIRPGTFLQLSPGERLELYSATPGNENGILIAAKIREIAAGIGLPTHLVDGDLTGANFSSLRAGLLPFRARVEAAQYQIVAPALDRIWRRVTGADVPEWLMPAPPPVDALKQVEADAAELAAGLTSRRKLVAARGWDLAQLDAELAAEGWSPAPPPTEPAPKAPRPRRPQDSDDADA
jgi:capsid protein